jgi:glycosyltransferase involved in cell wall biosynthesis
MVAAGPLAPELGAVQLALSLAAALTRRGHQVALWSTDEEPPPAGLRAREATAWRRRRVLERAAREPHLDAVDAPPLLVGRALAQRWPVVARSVQPDLRYFAAALPTILARSPRHPRSTIAGLLLELRHQLQALAGVRRSALLLCLGSAEERWWRRRAPWLQRRLGHLVTAPAPRDRERLAAVRDRRRPPRGPGVRYLWLGRWSPHKGAARLVRFLEQHCATHPADTCTVAGGGEEPAGALAGLAAAGRVRVVPRFSREELPELLLAHDAGLFTSTAEGWGLSLSEMLESGMPVFATREGAVPDLEPFFPELLRPFPPVDPAAALSHAGDPPGPGYDERFSWEAIARDYEAQVLPVLTRRATPPGRSPEGPW